MLITTYTSYAEIRAALGVGEKELADETIALPLYEHALDEELYSIATDLPTTFDTVSAIDEASRSVPQRRFLGSVNMFATYAVAVQLSSSLPLFAPKEITDGKAGVTRDASSPYKMTIAKCQSEFDRTRALVVSTLASLGSGGVTGAVRPFFSVSSPSTDIVTG